MKAKINLNDSSIATPFEQDEKVLIEHSGSGFQLLADSDEWDGYDIGEEQSFNGQENDPQEDFTLLCKLDSDYCDCVNCETDDNDNRLYWH